MSTTTAPNRFSAPPATKNAPPVRRTFALVGNPNSGKTTLFNALTGLRQKVGNYPGVTVERKVGTLTLADGQTANLLDLPGLYSLTPHSPDEVIARDVLLGYRDDTPRPDAVVCVVDAANLERNLYLASQLLDLGLPTLIALTMTDTAAQHGLVVDTQALEKALGVPVHVVVAARKQGLDELRASLATLPELPLPPARRWRLDAAGESALASLACLLESEHGLDARTAFAEALALLALPEDQPGDTGRWSFAVQEMVARLRNGENADANHDGVPDLSSAIAHARYADVEAVAKKAVRRAPSASSLTLSDKIDRIVLHRFWGYAIFLGLMYVVFQAMFSWAGYPQSLIEAGVNAVQQAVSGVLGPGDLRSLLVDGAIAGVGNTLVFLPQILLLFLFISLLEDTGYLARAAFLMDRLMSRVGLHGKSFIPLLSSYACAIPGIMATRTIEQKRARILTILVAPLMSCSARLPVYAVMIGAFIPQRKVLGVFSLPALTLLSMYALGTVAAFGMAALFNRTLLRGNAPSFLLEMPPYRLPSWKTVLFEMGERAWLFVRRAGQVILPLTILLWFLASYPKAPGGANASEGEQMRFSFAGWLGRAIEPAIAPLGFDWKMGIGIVTSFAAREVFVSAMGTIYNVADAGDDDKQTVVLQDKLKSDVDPRTGKHTFTPLVAVALMVYYVLAMQCMSTIAVVRRETNGWKWPLFQVAYMTALAWIVTFVVYQGGRLLGWG